MMKIQTLNMNTNKHENCFIIKYNKISQGKIYKFEHGTPITQI